MRRPVAHILMTVALAGCATAPSAIRPVREFDDFARALEAEIVEAKKELIATGACTHRVWSACVDGSTIAQSDGFVGSVSYFDSRGRAIGEEKSSCLQNEAKGLQPECRKPEETLVCPLALARLRRVAVTVRFEAKELRVEQDAEFDATEFRGLLHFDENPLHPISLRVTAIAPKVELRATPVPLGSMESYARSLTGVAMPTVEALGSATTSSCPSQYS